MTTVILLGLCAALLAAIVFLSKNWGEKDAEVTIKEKEIKNVKEQAQDFADTPVTALDAARKLRDRANGKD